MIRALGAAFLVGSLWVLSLVILLASVPKGHTAPSPARVGPAVTHTPTSAPGATVAH